jgi:type IV fimbrial biogenesis protein FimT
MVGIFSLGGSGHHARSDQGLTGAIVPFRVLIAPFILQPVAKSPVPAYVVTAHKGSGMSVFRPSRQLAARRRQRGQGFTLIELMVTVAVIAIVAAVAMPGMVALVNSYRLTGASGELTAALQLARSEAIRRNARVTVCSSADGATCSNATAWARWIVVGRDNATGLPEVIRDETMQGAMQLSGPAGGIQFNPSGIMRAQQALTVCLPTDKPEDNQRVVNVLISGGVTSAKNNGGGSCP